MNKLIGLCGFAGSGKDATAALLRMSGYRRVAFADSVREEVQDLLSGTDVPLEKFPKELWDLLKKVTIEEVWGKPTSPRMRRVLQLWGTEFRRAQDPEYWTKKGMSKVDKLRRDVPVVVTDVRFPNEVQKIRSRGGELWKIYRPGKFSDGHSSEESIREIEEDRVLVNSGTLLELAELVLPWV